MSDLVFPDLVGLDWDIDIFPLFNVEVQEAKNGREVRNQLTPFPRWELNFTYTVLRDGLNSPIDAYNQTELQRLLNFYLQVGGGFDDFLINPGTLTKRDRSFVSGSPIGTGDSASTIFLLLRPYGSYMDWVQNPAGGLVQIFLDDIEKTQGTDYTFSNGYITFGAAPGTGVKITASFTAFWRCRFNTTEAGHKRSQNSSDVSFRVQVLDLWMTQGISLVTVIT